MKRPTFLALMYLAVLAACGQAIEPATEDNVPLDEQGRPDSPAPATAGVDIQHYLMQTFPEAASLSYGLAFFDLDGDGADEAIVHVVSPWVCGSGGCTTLILTQAGPMWREVGYMTVSRPPVSVADSETNGWKDLVVAIGGGGMEASQALMRFGGEAYPGNPTTAPALPVGAGTSELIAEDFVPVQLVAAPE